MAATRAPNPIPALSEIMIEIGNAIASRFLWGMRGEILKAPFGTITCSSGSMKCDKASDSEILRSLRVGRAARFFTTGVRAGSKKMQRQFVDLLTLSQLQEFVFL